MRKKTSRLRAIADLEWAINSPSLIDSCVADFDSLPIIHPKQIDQDHFLEFLASNPTNRVGRYFETLVLYFLRHIQKFEIIATGQPIVVDKCTVGEIDFLYRDHAGVLSHLEVAVKFYLHLPGKPHNGSHLVGPHAADTFERKTEKLVNHQLPLSETHCPEVDRRIALMKGRIYYHVRSSDSTVSPLRLAENHNRGFWIHCSELDDLSVRTSGDWQLLTKPHWLTVDPFDQTLTFDQFTNYVRAHFSNSIFPLHCASIANGREQQRGFIVSDRWPNADAERA